VDAHIADNIRVVKALIDDDGGSTKGKGGLGSNNGLMLVRNSGFEEGGGGADDGEEKNGKVGTSHGEGFRWCVGGGEVIMVELLV
jgi:hypothetical protein